MPSWDLGSSEKQWSQVESYLKERNQCLRNRQRKRRSATTVRAITKSGTAVERVPIACLVGRGAWKSAAAAAVVRRARQGRAGRGKATRTNGQRRGRRRGGKTNSIYSQIETGTYWALSSESMHAWIQQGCIVRVSVVPVKDPRGSRRSATCPTTNATHQNDSAGGSTGGSSSKRASIRRNR